MLIDHLQSRRIWIPESAPANVQDLLLFPIQNCQTEGDADSLKADYGTVYDATKPTASEVKQLKERQFNEPNNDQSGRGTFASAFSRNAYGRNFNNNNNNCGLKTYLLAKYHRFRRTTVSYCAKTTTKVLRRGADPSRTLPSSLPAIRYRSQSLTSKLGSAVPATKFRINTKWHSSQQYSSYNQRKYRTTKVKRNRNHSQKRSLYRR